MGKIIEVTSCYTCPYSEYTKGGEGFVLKCINIHTPDRVIYGLSNIVFDKSIAEWCTLKDDDPFLEKENLEEYFQYIDYLVENRNLSICKNDRVEIIKRICNKYKDMKLSKALIIVKEWSKIKEEMEEVE